MVSHHLKSTRVYVPMNPEPDEYLVGVSVDFAHHIYLTRLLLQVRLVDTDGVDPDLAALHLWPIAQVPEGT